MILFLFIIDDIKTLVYFYCSKVYTFTPLHFQQWKFLKTYRKSYGNTRLPIKNASLLKRTSDRKEHRINDLVEELAAEFLLTKDERKELLPSGQTLVFGSRVAGPVLT